VLTQTVKHGGNEMNTPFLRKCKDFAFHCIKQNEMNTLALEKKLKFPCALFDLGTGINGSVLD
jgi:hypothetical protein